MAARGVAAVAASNEAGSAKLMTTVFNPPTWAL
jgi:hypothetical protein